MESNVNLWPQPETSIAIQWSQKALEDLQTFNIAPQFVQLLEERLQGDPRPQSQKHHKEKYFIRQNQWDIEVHFSDVSANILGIKEWRQT